ncbi:MAG: hypothetical protein U1E29_03255 [Coriobacteriia bacterium]|nr:hypothetical protein [Coriobacteriia bacterium]
MNPNELQGLLRDSLTELAWSQWTAIGVAGSGVRASALIDPEALLVASTSIARWDARLFDEILDWVSTNGTLLDAARLRRMAEQATPAQRRVVLAILRSADRGREITPLQRVEDALVAKEEPATYGTEPLFHAIGAGPAHWTSLDDTFADLGFQRSIARLKSMSTPPDGLSPACLRFALRGLVGTGARAEVLAYLLTHEWAHGRLIAEYAAYNQSVVAEYLASLFDAGQAEKRVRGRRLEYRIVGLLQDALPNVPESVAWHRVWPALAAILEALSADISEQAQWVRLADALDAQSEELSSEGFELDVPRMDGWATHGTAGIEAAVHKVSERCRVLAGHRQ